MATPETLTVPVPSKGAFAATFGTPLGFSVAASGAGPSAGHARARGGVDPVRLSLSRNLPFPVGVPVGTGEIVAVNVTAAPTVPAGFGEPVRVVVVVVAAAG